MAKTMFCILVIGLTSCGKLDPSLTQEEANRMTIACINAGGSPQISRYVGSRTIASVQCLPL